MRKTLTLTLFILFASCISDFKTTAQYRKPLEQADATVKVTTLCVIDDPFSGAFVVGMHNGSGVVVSKRHVVTADHVVTCPTIPSVSVTFADGRKYAVVVDKELPGPDLARLQIASAGTWHISVPTPVIAQAEVGESLCTASALPERAWHCGVVEAIQQTIDGDIVHTARTIKGNSGGGAYDSQGRLIGIVVMQRIPYANDAGGLATSLVNRNLLP